MTITTNQQLAQLPEGTHKIDGNLYITKKAKRGTFTLQGQRNENGGRTVATCLLGYFPELSLPKALAWKKEREALSVSYLRNKRAGIKAPKKVTFSQVIEEYVRRRKEGIGKAKWAARTLRNNNYRLERYVYNTPIGNTPINELDQGLLTAWYELIAKKANNQAYKLYCVINPALKKAKIYIPGVDATSLVLHELPFVKNEVTPHKSIGFGKGGANIGELRDLYNAIDKNGSYEISKLALKTIILSGLRIGSVLQLRKDDYDQELGTLTARRATIKFKGNRKWDVVVPVGPHLKVVLDKAVLIEPENEWLFPTPIGRASAKCLSEATVGKLCKFASNGKSTPHGFRTTITSYCVQIQELAPQSLDYFLDHVGRGETAKSYVKNEEGSPLANKVLLAYQMAIGSSKGLAQLGKIFESKRTS